MEIHCLMCVDIFQTICIALGIEQATLRHRGDKGIAWLTQLMDVLDVLDYPVPGYSPSTVLSELHVHVLDCAVDYRLVVIGNSAIYRSICDNTCNFRKESKESKCSVAISSLVAKEMVAIFAIFIFNLFYLGSFSIYKASYYD